MVKKKIILNTSATSIKTPQEATAAFLEHIVYELDEIKDIAKENNKLLKKLNKQ